jgi:hypothetical protein
VYKLEIKQETAKYLLDKIGYLPEGKRNITLEMPLKDTEGRVVPVKCDMDEEEYCNFVGWLSDVVGMVEE